MCVSAEKDRIAVVIGGLGSGAVPLLTVEVYNTFNKAGVGLFKKSITCY